MDDRLLPTDGTGHPTAPPAARTRRDVLKLGVAAAAAGVAATTGHGPQRVFAQRYNTNGARRSQLAYNMRLAAANQSRIPDPKQTNNGDEARYPTRIGSFTKGMPHNNLGEVSLPTYTAYLKALDSGSWQDWENIPMGGPLLFKNPLAGIAYVLEGGDPGCMTQRAAPTFASAESAGEIVENYWMALLRDVSFTEYAADGNAAAAAADLSRMSDFRGPRQGGAVTPATLFRGLTAGDLTGPYISQFMWLDTRFGAESVDRRMRTMQPGVDFMTSYADWLAIQRGAPPPLPAQPDPTPRYIRNGRDLSEWVHIDVLYQAYLDAMLILFGLGAPTNTNDPYRLSRTMCGFGTLGPPYFASILAAVAKPALETVWHQKWYVHRRLRPEAFAGRVHHRLTGTAAYPVHNDVLNSDAVMQAFSRHGTYLLPMAFPEGSPAHPAYGAGHATVAGACVTLLKAFFDESWVLPNPVVAAPDGLSLEPYAGPALTVGGELNKLASNVAIGRNIAGVHWRSDATESLKLGEDIAIRFLREEKMLLREKFLGWTFTKFDGTRITV
ncbi:MAG: vanadium-dependent haloperoxidase [Ardenticatenales bacterium]|nr:vanadium-dependent haloperoxidase [Ardenticatenales bacterium]